MKKWTAFLMVITFCLVNLAGCGNVSGPTQTPAAPDTEQDGTAVERQEADVNQPLKGDITFWHSFVNGPRLESIQKAANEFMAENPGVNITIETFSWGDFYTKWTSSLATGNVPDMSTALPAHVAEMIDAEAIIPLNDLIDDVGRDRFYEAPLQEMTIEGNTYAVPLYSHAQVMWIRKDLLEKAGRDIPKTWDELYDTAKALTGDGIYGCCVPMGIGDRMATRFLNFYVRSGGGTLLTEDQKADLTSPLALDGIRYWVKMYETCSPPDSVNYKCYDKELMYYQGNTAFDFESGFQIEGVQENSPELVDYIDCAPMPKINENDPVYGIETSNIPMVIWKNSKHPEICKAFIRFLYEDDRYIEFLSATPAGMLPALKDIAQNEKYLSNPVIQKYSNAVTVISDAVAIGTEIGFENGPCPQASILTSQGVIEAMFQDIVINKTDVETAAQAAEDKLNELFETVR